jgi:hypothetical protein|tara:strand:+ start:112 stop:321 length:210 start_codon:yes stop_codon:yes gene_type:complete
MIWTLLLVTAMNTAPSQVGSFTTQEACQVSAKEWQSQGVKAGCIPQQSPEEAMNHAVSIMNTFISSLPK